jgi:tRNA 2-thiouridine synthesizing protein A
MSKYEVKDTIDITKDVCPITFVKTKLKLEELHQGEILEIILKDGEALLNVPRSLKGEGHKILALEKLSEDIFKLTVEKGAD